MYNRRNTFAGEMSKRAYECEHRGSMTRESKVQVKEFRNRNMQYRRLEMLKSSPTGSEYILTDGVLVVVVLMRGSCCRC
jgi:hypothetical protein